jgi:hypothetical protein
VLILDAPSIDEGAVSAREIGDLDTLVRQRDAGVPARDLVVVEKEDAVRGGPAELDRLAIERERSAGRLTAGEDDDEPGRRYVGGRAHQVAPLDGRLLIHAHPLRIADLRSTL